MRWPDGIIDSMDMSLSKLWKTVKDRKAWCIAFHWGHKKLDTTEQVNKNSSSVAHPTVPVTKKCVLTLLKSKQESISFI